MRLTVAVRLFARLREVAGADLVRLDLERATVAAVRDALAGRCPEAAALIARSAVAVNGGYATDDQPVVADDEVALIPPVSGG